MDKFGVVVDDSHVKQASTDMRCPQCGFRTVTYRGNVPYCLTCGTEPWEKKHGKKEEERGR